MAFPNASEAAVEAAEAGKAAEAAEVAEAAEAAEAKAGKSTSVAPESSVDTRTCAEQGELDVMVEQQSDAK